MLAARAAGRGDDAGGQVRQADAGVGGVLVLTARTAGPKRVHATLGQQVPVRGGDVDRTSRRVDHK